MSSLTHVQISAKALLEVTLNGAGSKAGFLFKSIN